MITLDEFKKVEIRVGCILSAEKVEGTDKLLKLMVDFGEEKEGGTSSQRSAISARGRQIISGIALFFPDPEVLVGKRCAFAANLEPRVIRGLESQGMILAVNGENGEQRFFSLLETSSDVTSGSVVK